MTLIENCINYKFTAIKDTFSYHKILRSFDKNILNLPIIDEKGHFIDLLNYSTFKDTYFLNDQRIISCQMSC